MLCRKAQVFPVYKFENITIFGLYVGTYLLFTYINYLQINNKFTSFAESALEADEI